MAVTGVVPDTLAEGRGVATAQQAQEWAVAYGSWIKDILTKHSAWLKEAEVEKYQQAYDGKMESIETRDKSRGDDVNNKLFVNLAQLIIDTAVDYMIAKPPVWTVEDPEADPTKKDATGQIVESDLVKEYRLKMIKLLRTQQAQRVLSEQLRQGSIACYSGVIAWVDEKGRIDYEEFPVQELIPVYDVRGRLIMVLRKYSVERMADATTTETLTRVEVYDDRYITYYIGDDQGDNFVLDEEEVETGNPVEHLAGRIPVSIFINGTAATYEQRVKRYGTSDIGNGVFSLLEAYAAGLSDKANISDYLQDQYLALIGVDVDEKEVIKMRKARAIALKSKDSKAEFIAQSQEDGTVEHYLDRLKDAIFDTTFTPKLNDLEGATATEIKMKYAALDIKAGKKEVYFVDAINQLVEILTDLLNAQKLIDDGVDSPYEVLSDPDEMESRDDLYKAEWLTFTLNRNLPQNYKEIADIVAELAGKVPDSYLYELLWFIDDPKAALEDMKAQKAADAANNMTALGYGGEFGSTSTTDGSGDQGNQGGDTGGNV